MSQPIFLDTSVIISVFRGELSKQTVWLREAELHGENIVVPAVCVQEVLQGAKDEKQWRLLYRYFTSQNIIVAKDPIQTYIEAARLFYLGRRKRITIRSATDCLIAQLAIEHDGILLHCDRDFEKIKRISKLQTII